MRKNLTAAALIPNRIGFTAGSEEKIKCRIPGDQIHSKVRYHTTIQSNTQRCRISPKKGGVAYEETMHQFFLP